MKKDCCVQWWPGSPLPPTVFNEGQMAPLGQHPLPLIISSSSHSATTHRAEPMTKALGAKCTAPHTGSSLPLRRRRVGGGRCCSSLPEMWRACSTATAVRRNRWGEDRSSSVWISTLPLLESKCDLIQMRHTSSPRPMSTQCHCGTGFLHRAPLGMSALCATEQERGFLPSVGDSILHKTWETDKGWRGTQHLICLWVFSSGISSAGDAVLSKNHCWFISTWQKGGVLKTAPCFTTKRNETQRPSLKGSIKHKTFTIFLLSTCDCVACFLKSGPGTAEGSLSRVWVVLRQERNYFHWHSIFGAQWQNDRLL